MANCIVVGLRTPDALAAFGRIHSSSRDIHAIEGGNYLLADLSMAHGSSALDGNEVGALTAAHYPEVLSKMQLHAVERPQKELGNKGRGK